MFQHPPMRRASSRLCLFAAYLLATAAAQAVDLSPDVQMQALPFKESASDSGPLLSIDEASALALTDQPELRMREAAVATDEALAVSAAQLPDPKLVVGIKDLPVDTHSAFSVRDDDFTMFSVGFSQDFPRAEKRRLRGERKGLEAAAGRLGLEDGRREIRRDAALAWLDVFEAEHAWTLARELGKEFALQSQALESDYRSGRASQADWLAAKVEAGLANDKEQDWRHHIERMRAVLFRWIGDAALRPLADDLSTLALPADFPLLDASVDRHPAVAALDKQIEVSEDGVKLARQAYKSDVSVESYFGYRPAYSDFAGIQVSVDLPFFTANRQDRELAAAMRQSDAAQDRKADALRELHAQAAEDFIDWHHNRARAGTFDSLIIPDAERRVDAARGAYAAAHGRLDAVLTARRSLLDLQLQRLALAVDAARAQVRLQYFIAERGAAS